MKKEKFEKELDNTKKDRDNMVPIYKRCPSRGEPCFCTGECQTIIGYRKKHRLER